MEPLTFLYQEFKNQKYDSFKNLVLDYAMKVGLVIGSLTYVMLQLK
ncbi:hypothetical protein IFVP69_C1150058 [Vibrio parahaemolyticus]